MIRWFKNPRRRLRSACVGSSGGNSSMVQKSATCRAEEVADQVGVLVAGAVFDSGAYVDRGGTADDDGFGDVGDGETAGEHPGFGPRAAGQDRPVEGDAIATGKRQNLSGRFGIKQ